MRKRLGIFILLLIGFASNSKAGLIVSPPQIANTEVKGLEVGSSPKITVRYKNTSKAVIRIASAKIKFLYNDQIIDNILSLKNENPALFEEKENQIQPSEIVYALEKKAQSDFMEIWPNKTIDLVTINFHLLQKDISQKRMLKQFLFSVAKCEIKNEKGAEVGGKLPEPEMSNLANSEPPRFSGLGLAASRNNFGFSDVGNTMVLNWRTAGQGATDKTKYSNRKLHFKLYRDGNLISSDISHQPDEAPSMRTPYVGNIEGTDYIYQDGMGDGTGRNSTLSDGSTYKYKVIAVDDTSPSPNEDLNEIVLNGVPMDLRPPGEVFNLTAEVQGQTIKLKWKNPSDADFGGVAVMRKAGKPVGGGMLGGAQVIYPYNDGPEYNKGDTPLGSGNGEIIFISSQGMPIDQYEDSEAESGVLNHYKVFTYDRAENGPPREMGRNYSNGVAAVQLANFLPESITNFAVTPGATEGELLLSWNNPLDKVSSGIVIYSTTQESFLADDNSRIMTNWELVGVIPTLDRAGEYEEVPISLPLSSPKMYFMAFSFNQTKEEFDPESPKSIADHMFSERKLANFNLQGKNLAVETTGSIKAGKVSAAVVAEKLEPKVNIWFDNRLYQKGMVNKGSKQIISGKPKVKIEVSVKPPFSIPNSVSAFEAAIDGHPQPLPKISVSAAEEKKEVDSLSFSYVPENSLSDGEHAFTISIPYKGPKGETFIIKEIASVEVLGGPLRVVYEPLTFPSPFSISKNKIVKIQYNLSQTGDITISLISVGGETIKVWKIFKDEEGGRAGINNIEWNGLTDKGTLAGNAVYVGLIQSSEDKRLLAKFKLSIFD